MTTYTLLPYPGEAILLLTFTSDFNIAKDMAEVTAKVNQFMDAVTEPHFYIADTEHLSVSFTEMIQAASASARTSGANLHHPNMREFLLVSTNKLISLAGKGLDSDAFGHVNVHVFETRESALGYARQQMG